VKRFLIPLLGFGLLSACASPSAILDRGAVAITVAPEVTDGRMRTLEVVNPYVKGDIDHLVLKLYTVANSTETPVRIGLDQHELVHRLDGNEASLSATVTFYNLHPLTDYRVRAYAYRDAAGLQQISDDVVSFRDINPQNNTTPEMLHIPVKLVDRTVRAEATSRVDVTPGELHNTDESIE
jgi:hypothetical protein